MTAPKLHGQADRFIVSPSEGICFTITCRGASSFETQLLRLKGGRREEANPDLGGIAVRSSINARYERRRHGICRRPYLEVPGSENALSGAAGISFGAFIRSDGAKLTSHWRAAEESFRGTLESPYAIANATRASDLQGLHARRLNSPALLAAWDFSQGLSDDGIHPDEVPDVTGSFDARCVNAPLRAVQGHLGNAIEIFRTAPERYGAIRLLDRQPDAKKWQSQITLAIPESLETGFYAVRISTANTAEYVPFVVSPPRQPTLQRPDDRGRTQLSSAHEAKTQTLSTHRPLIQFT